MILNGGLSGTNLTLWGFLKNPRTFEIQSEQEKRALKGSFSKNGGLSGTKLTLLSKEIIEVCKEKNNIIFFEVLQNWLAA